MRFPAETPVLLALTLLAAVWGCSKSPKGTSEATFNDQRVVLQVADNELTLGEVQKRFADTDFRDIQQEYDVKKGFVERFLERFLLIEGAKEAAFVADLDTSIYRRTLLKELYNQEIMSKINIGDRELNDFFKKYGGEYQAGHILVADSTLAESLYQVLVKGGDFEALVKEFSKDEFSAPSGGSLGYVNYGKFDDRFQDAAFNMNIGDISRPVHTRKGWHIIKLFDRRKTSKEDLEKEKSKYRGLAHQYHEKMRVFEFVNELKKRYDYRVEDSTIQMLLVKADSVRALGVKPSDLPSSSYLDSSLFSDREKGMYLVKSSAGSATVGDYLDLLRDYARTGEKSPEMRERDIFGDILEGMVMPKLLVRLADDEGIENSESFKAEIKYLEGSQLMEKMRSRIYGDVGEITEADIVKYYDDHPDKFFFPDQIRAFAIAVKTRKEAAEFLERIKAGANFMQLAQEYSVDKQTGALGGDLNLFSAARYPAIYKAAERLRIGDLGGPVKMDGNWWIFQLADRRNKSLKELDLARADIRSQIGQDRRANLYNDWIAKMKEKTTCKMNLELVKENLRMGRLPETDTSKG